MKFKAFLTDNGVNLLEKRFLPSLDKIGRICLMYLTRDHVFFLHNLLNSDGIQSIAQFRKEALFEEYRISNQNDDRIAFTIDLGLLHRSLRSSVSIEGGERLQIKLVKKLPAGGSNLPMPFLTFETKGYKSALIQDVPISKPLSRTDVMELQAALDTVQDLPQSLVQVPDLIQLQHQVDRLKHIGDLLDVSITQYGDLHLRVSTTVATVGSEFCKLRVLGVQANIPAGTEGLSARTRTEMAIQGGEAQSVQVSVKHFLKSLLCHLTKPNAAFYGGSSNFDRLMVGLKKEAETGFRPNLFSVDKSSANTEEASYMLPDLDDHLNGMSSHDILNCEWLNKACVRLLRAQVLYALINLGAHAGIAPQGPCLTAIFQFFIPGTQQTDRSISLHCRLPVLDTGSG